MPPVELNILGDKLSGYIRRQTLEAFLRKRYPQFAPHEFSITETRNGYAFRAPEVIPKGELNLIRSAEPEEVGQILGRRVAWVPDPGRSSTPSRTLNEFLLNVNLFTQSHSSETRSLRAQVDTGAAPLFINLAKAEELGFKLEPYYGKEFIAANDKPIEIWSTTRQAWYPDGGRQAMWDEFLVVKNLPFDVVVGRERWHEVKEYLSAGVLADAERKGPGLVFDVNLTQRYDQSRSGYQQSQSSPYIQQTAVISGMPRHSDTYWYATSYTGSPYEQQSESHGLISPTSSVSTGHSEFERTQRQWTWSAEYNRYYRAYTDQRGQTKYEWAPQTT